MGGLDDDNDSECHLHGVYIAFPPVLPVGDFGEVDVWFIFVVLDCSDWIANVPRHHLHPRRHLSVCIPRTGESMMSGISQREGVAAPRKEVVSYSRCESMMSGISQLDGGGGKMTTQRERVAAPRK